MIPFQNINLDAVDLDDIINLYEKKDICVCLNDGKITDFVMKSCEDAC